MRSARPARAAIILPGETEDLKTAKRRGDGPKALRIERRAGEQSSSGVKKGKEKMRVETPRAGGAVVLPS